MHETTRLEKVNADPIRGSEHWKTVNTSHLGVRRLEVSSNEKQAEENLSDQSP